MAPNFYSTRCIMKDYEKIIVKDDLMVEVWWEPGDNEFRAAARVDQTDDGWMGSGDSVTVALVMSIAAYKTDRDRAKAS